MAHAAPSIDVGEQLTNTLLVELAPILELFGQEITKQFLSESIGFADDIMFAMAPVGLLTAMLGAIRVAGYPILRNLVGRGREPEGEAELELLSSTSNHVCELWGGGTGDVVRVLGHKPEIREVLIDETPGKESFCSTTEALHNNILLPEISGLLGKSVVDVETAKSEERSPPNLTLNVRYDTQSRWWVRLGAVLGVIIQSAALVLQGLVTYQFQWRNGDQGIPRYAFPLACSGTVMLCTGMLACAQALRKSTITKAYVTQETTEKKHKRFVWLQKGGQIVNHQHFDAFAIRKEKGHQCIGKDASIVLWSSSKNTKANPQLQLWTSIAACTSLVGWIAQFIGLSQLHWSAILFQLAAIVFMVLLRSYIRARLLQKPEATELTPGFEMEQIVLETANLKSWSMCHHGIFEADDEGKPPVFQKSNIFSS